MGDYCVVVVEGPSDAKYYSAWMDELNIPAVAVEVDLIEPPEEGYPVGEFASGRFVEFGKRDRVLWHAREEGAPDSGVAFLVDLDFDDPEDLEVENAQVFVTDFPAIESYWLVPQAVEWFIRAFDVLPGVPASPKERQRMKKSFVSWFVQALGALLAPLYGLRRLQRETAGAEAWPPDLRKFAEVGEPGVAVPTLDLPRLAAELKVPIDPQLEVDAPPSRLGDLRPLAYGHDVAHAIWVLYPRLRQSHSVTSWEALESHMLASLQADWLKDFPLFRNIAGWAQA